MISTYNGEVPLAAYLKLYYKKHPQLGSRDRKAISEAVHIYYRYVDFSESKNPIDIIATGLEKAEYKNVFLQRILENINISKLTLSAQQFKDIILSKGIDKEDWELSRLKQPNLFIRILKNTSALKQLLDKNDIDYKIVETQLLNNTCLQLPYSTPVEKILPKEDFVIQDWASQNSLQIGFKKSKTDIQQSKKAVWDVCSGAGGKSLLLKSIIPDSTILATDVRKSILHNYQERMQQAGFHDFTTTVLDVTDENDIKNVIGNKRFDIIICDVPCSGSGTWARTPEQYYFFDKKSIKSYASIQYQIAANAIKYLNGDGLFFYITCSVFKQENEDIVTEIANNTGLTILHQQIINGIEHHADSMFIAVFIK